MDLGCLENCTKLCGFDKAPVMKFSETEELGVKCWISYDDPRYPTLVLSSENFGTIGYDLNLNSGELSRICLCHAHSVNECVCGAWDLEV